ncbi:SEC-C metal-binding domain-containing protein [Paenisporosarcina sp. TG20]|uniref:SEC-C metal-binding domain-containing protein n=1 Tax=Paenisporosarcina sp. TG20 TaxID=1211706 RepID=UPI0002D36867|nr:SEC-C metal-binding domain-containing protein [Paenisporosarcina sp. TG20]
MTKIDGEKFGIIGRNSLCSCQSGKKYKKCCGTKEGTDRFNDELDQAMQKVLQDFFENNPHPSEQKALLAWKDKNEDLLVPLYGKEKSGSIIGDIFFFLERVDIWNSFINRKILKEERYKIRKILEGWLNPVFLVGKILSVTNYQAQIQDLLSENVLQIDVNESFPVESGNVAIGFYLPDIIHSDRLMVLNSVTVAVEVKEEAIQKLSDMYRSSEIDTVQGFYRENIITLYQLFSTGLSASHYVSSEVIEAVNALEQFLIEEDLKSDELIEGFFHYLELQPNVPNAAIAGAVQFGIDYKLLKFEWSKEKIADYFTEDSTEINMFAENLRAFYSEALTNEDEKEATYAFEVGTDPKTNEYQNWQLLMHLKNLTITSDIVLKRHMDYYHGEPYVPKSKTEEAQLLAYEAYANKTEGLRAEKSQKVHQLHSRIVDEFLLAADVESNNNEREKLLIQAIANGKADFEPDMDVAWLYVPNRPYLRALFLLGIHYWQQGRLEEAFKEFYRLLQLNPGDHQGVRYVAMSTLIALGRLQEADSIINHYEDQQTDNAFYAWFKWLIQMKKTNLLSSATQEAFLEAVDKNPYVKKLVDKRPKANPYPKSIILSPRSPEEAKLIWTFLEPGL